MGSNNKEVLKWLKFSGIAIQMGAIILLGNLGGTYLDKKFERTDELWTKLVTFAAVMISMVLVIREVIKMNKN